MTRLLQLVVALVATVVVVGGVAAIAFPFHPPRTEVEPVAVPTSPFVVEPEPEIVPEQPIEEPSPDVELPGGLSSKRLWEIEGVFLNWCGFNPGWSKLKDDGAAVIPYIEHILTHDEHDYLLMRAMIFANQNLTKYDCRRLIEPTVPFLQHQNWEIRAEAMMLLAQTGSQPDCPAVAVLLHDSHHNHMVAACTLAKLGGRSELFALDHWLKHRAADASGDRNTRDAFEYVKKSRDELRERLEKEEKAKPAEPTDADRTVDKFADADAKVRLAAVEALRKVGSRADSTAVVALLHDPVASVRTASAEWLGAMGGKRELVALEIRIREPRASDDEAFDAMAKARRAVTERVEADEKKEKAPNRPDGK